MSEFDGAGSRPPIIDQQPGLIPNVESEQAAGIGVAINLEMPLPNSEANPAFAVEMPASHPVVDPATLTAGGLTKACPYFAELAAKNPELANRQAEAAIQVRREEVEMQQRGMDSAAIKSRQWSSMRERHREKQATRQSPESEEAPTATHESTRQTTPEQPAAVKRAEHSIHPAQHHEAVAAKASLPEQTPLENVVRHKPFIEAVAAPVSRGKEVPSPVVAARASQALAHAEVTTAARVTDPVHTRQVEALPGALAYQAATYQEALKRGPADTPEEPETVMATFEAEPEHHAEEPAYMTDEVAFMQRETARLQSVYTQEEPAAIPRAASPAKPHRGITSLHELADRHLPVIEPVAVVESFTEALRGTIAAISAPQPESEEFATESDEVAPVIQSTEQHDMAERPEPPPAIAITVAERLTALDTPEQQEEVSPVLQEIATEAETIKIMAETAYVEPEIIKMETALLEESITELFEQLRRRSDPSNPFEYDQADVEQFVAILLRRDFQPQQPKIAEMNVPDLEHDGTHEVKRRFAQLADSLADVEERMHQLLGGFVVFHASHDRQYELAA